MRVVALDALEDLEEDLEKANKIAADACVKHFNQQGIGMICFIGLNINSPDAPGAFTILTAGNDPSKIKQMLKVF